MLSSLFRRLSSPSTERRREPRGTEIDGQVSIEGRSYPLKDWSRRGFSAGAYTAEHYPGDKIDMEIEIEIDGEPLAFGCRAVVVWVDRDRRELAGVFTDLDMGVQEKIMRSVFSRQTDPRDVGSALHV